MLLSDVLSTLSDVATRGSFTLDGVKLPAPSSSTAAAGPPPQPRVAMAPPPARVPLGGIQIGSDLGLVRKLLGALTRHLSARDLLLPEEQLLLAAVGKALAESGGAVALAEERPPEGEAYLAGGGGGCPALLHTLLGVHMRLLLHAAASTQAPLALHRAVNALHLLRALFQQRGMQSGSALRLFLPCLLRPLVQVLAAGVVQQQAGAGAQLHAAAGGLQAVQLQVYKLSQRLLKQPGGMPLPPVQQPQQQGPVALFG